MKPFLLSEHDIYRLLRDIFRSGPASSRKILPPDADFTDPEWSLDSIEIMGLAATVNEMFHLSKTGLEDNLLRFKTLDKWIEIISISWREHPEEISFRTSGSTGEPRLYTHFLSNLIQEIKELAELFSDRKRVLSMVPCHHIYGFLFTLLLPRYMEIEVAEARDMGIGKLADELRTGDLIISYPLHWAYLERSLAVWPSGIYGVSSTGSISIRLIQALQKKGIARITEIYGSSETAGIGYRHDPDAPYTLFSYWRKGENSAEDKPVIIRKSPDGKSEPQTLLPDIVKWQTSRTFRPLGRRDGAVQVGGVNVYPERISEKIRQHPLVADCAVRLTQQHEIPRLKAFIVPVRENGHQNIHEELNRWLAQNFSSAERPVHLTFGKKLPRSSMGKMSDWPTTDAENFFEVD